MVCFKRFNLLTADKPDIIMIVPVFMIMPVFIVSFLLPTREPKRDAIKSFFQKPKVLNLSEYI